MNKREIGNIYEEKAADYIKSRGLEVVERNFNCRFGEIDIIALDTNRKVIFFYEVKYRKNNRFGTPFEAVDQRKQNRIILTSKYYLINNKKYSDYKVCYSVIGFFGEELKCMNNVFS